MPPARISLTLSRHFSQSSIASGRSSGLHPLFSHSCCMYVRAGRPTFARPHVGVHRSTSLMSSSLLLQQCPACLVRLAWIVFVMGGWWPYEYAWVFIYVGIYPICSLLAECDPRPIFLAEKNLFNFPSLLVVAFSRLNNLVCSSI